MFLRNRKSYGLLYTKCVFEQSIRQLSVAAILFTLSTFSTSQTLYIGQSGLPATLDTGQDGNSLTVAYQVVENLVAYAPGTANVAPGLALSWEPDFDATVWTFKLREGVKFHDGTDFNAEAVKFNFDRWNNQDNEYAYAADGKDLSAWTYVFGGYYGAAGYLLESVEAPDPTTVVFRLTRSNGFLPRALAASYYGMHSPQAIMEGGLEYGTPAGSIVGTGPFTFVEWIDGDRVTLDRNENYWGEPAKVEQIVFRGIEESATRLWELEAGTIDIAVNLSPDDYDVIQNNRDLRIAYAPPDLRIGYIGMHQGNTPFDNLLVRQAVAYAIDKEAIIDAFYGELGQVAGEFIPPGLFGHSSLEPYPYDPDMARQLLSEAGYPDGFETQFWYMPVSRPYYPNPQYVAEAVASNLADVGIYVELMTEDWGIYLDNYDQGKYPMYMLGWSADFADPDNFITPFFNPTEAVGAFGWDNPEVFNLIEQAQTEGDPAEREYYYHQLSQIIYEQVPALPMVFPSTLNASRIDIDCFLASPLGPNVELKYVVKEGSGLCEGDRGRHGGNGSGNGGIDIPDILNDPIQTDAPLYCVNCAGRESGAVSTNAQANLRVSFVSSGVTSGSSGSTPDTSDCPNDSDNLVEKTIRAYYTHRGDEVGQSLKVRRLDCDELRNNRLHFLIFAHNEVQRDPYWELIDLYLTLYKDLSDTLILNVELDSNYRSGLTRSDNPNDYDIPMNSDEQTCYAKEIFNLVIAGAQGNSYTLNLPCTGF